MHSDIIHKRLGDLHPDPHNPRLVLDQPGSLTEDRLLVELADRFLALDVAQSVARHGFFGSEPLVVCEEEGEWRVLEGNRRLAALLGLARPDLRRQFVDAPAWDALEPIREVSLDDEIPVLIADDRSDADPLIGYRHIGGILAWKPLQRAQFVAHLVDEQDKRFAEVAETVGETESTVRMLYRNQSILNGARELGRPDLHQLGQDSFGTYTAALNRTGLRQFVGAMPLGEVREGSPQIDEPRLVQLAQLFSWLYGLEGEQKVIRESRDLSMLAEVVKHAPALDELRRTRDLVAAFAMTPAPNTTLIRMLGIAVGNLRAVVASVDLVVDDERTRPRAEELRELTNELFSALEDAEDGTAEV